METAARCCGPASGEAEEGHEARGFVSGGRQGGAVLAREEAGAERRWAWVRAISDVDRRAGARVSACQLRASAIWAALVAP